MRELNINVCNCYSAITACWAAVHGGSQAWSSKMLHIIATMPDGWGAGWEGDKFFLKECCRRETFQKSYKTSLLELPCITRAALLLIRKRNDLSSIHTWCFSGFWCCCTSWAEMTPSHTPFTQQGRERQNIRISVLHYGPPWATKLPVNSYYKSNK